MTVLMVARTLTSTIRLLDVLDLFRGDFRVAFEFTIDEGSEFHRGVRTLLARSGVDRIVPWSEIHQGSHYRLAVSASEQVDLSRIGSTVVVLPHGVGFNKYVPDSDSSGVRLAGLPPESALHTGRVRLVLSHPEQHEQLRAVSPQIAGQAVVTGDPTYDQLLASRPLRQAYRQSVHAAARTVVLLSSTWGPGSTLGRWRELAARLVGELPADEYRVCLALHPNVWARYGRVVVRTWFADCVDAGLALLPPSRGWQAALLAADLVISDHGSVTVHAAGLGMPLLLAAYGDEVVPGTPVELLGQIAPRLDPATSLREQVDAAIADHDPDRFSAVTERVFAHVGEAGYRVRDLLYGELGLAPPATAPALRRPPFARLPRQTVRAFDVYTAFISPTTVSLLRFPRAVRSPGQLLPEPRPPWSSDARHLVVDEDNTDLRLTQMASVITRRWPAPPADALAWTEAALRNHPGARLAVAATTSGCVAMTQARDRIEVTADAADPLVLASAVYACLHSERPDGGELTVVAGLAHPHYRATIHRR